MTITVTTLNEWREIQKTLACKQVGLIPTMGNLHAGHLSLCARARNENEIIVTSIFVNPTQFNQASDFEKYPRTLAEDLQKLTDAQVDYTLIFEVAELYPDNYEVCVTEKTLGADLEGEYRPGHFDGMLTIVLKLLNVVQATRAYFGEKDYQQLILVKKMVSALFVPTQIIGCETVRADDGLAMSSRNTRLTPQQREVAPHFARLLQSALNIEQVKEQLTLLGFKVDYISEKWQRRLGAVWLDEVRLIDNVAMGG
jgi:pantoate--beta-alanine ligase